MRGCILLQIPQTVRPAAKQLQTFTTRCCWRCTAVYVPQMSQDGTRHEARLRAAPGLTTDVLRGGPGAYAVHRHLDADIAGGCGCLRPLTAIKRPCVRLLTACSGVLSRSRHSCHGGLVAGCCVVPYSLDVSCGAWSSIAASIGMLGCMADAHAMLLSALAHLHGPMCNQRCLHQPQPTAQHSAPRRHRPDAPNPFLFSTDVAPNNLNQSCYCLLPLLQPRCQRWTTTTTTL